MLEWLKRQVKSLGEELPWLEDDWHTVLGTSSVSPCARAGKYQPHRPREDREVRGRACEQ